MNTGCTFATERNGYKPEPTSTYYRHRKAQDGYLKFEGMEFHAFVGNMIRVAAYTGDHYLVDRWGGVWRMIGEWDIEIVTLDAERNRGYSDGFKWINDKVARLIDYTVIYE